IRDFHVTGVQTCALPIFDALGLDGVRAERDDGDRGLLQRRLAPFRRDDDFLELCVPDERQPENGNAEARLNRAPSLAGGTARSENRVCDVIHAASPPAALTAEA